MALDFIKGNGLEHLPAFVASLGIGLLMGLERERRPAAKAGLRTFALVALFGTISGMLAEQTGSPWVVFGGLLVVAIMTIAAYLRQSDPEADPGTTTVVAIVMCYSLGVLDWYGYATLAAMLAIVSTILLYYKTELSGISQSLTRREVISMLQFAVLTFIVLPILPDRNYGPYDAVNPHQAWLMVVLISGISLMGYVALKLFGGKAGAPLLGLLGGMVSSTATTLAYSRYHRANRELMALAVVVILLANLMVLFRLSMMSAIVSPVLFPKVALILGSGFALGLGAAIYWYRKLYATGTLPLPSITNPTEIRTALGFGLLYAIVLFCAAWLSDAAGSGGLYMVALISGLTDVDAIALSSLRLFGLGKLQQMQAVTAITLAVIANIGFKLGMVFTIGGLDLGRRCAGGMLLVAIGLAAALLVLHY